MAKIEDIKDNEVPEGFTMGLALVDAIPVIVFSLSVLVIALRFRKILFVIGALCSIFAGCGKVVWKLILACRKKNILWLNKQFRYMMSIGFLLMLLSVVVHWGSIQFSVILRRILSFPAVLFFILGIAGMAAMAVMGRKLDPTVPKNNWAEQITNALAQTMIFIGILLW